MARFFLDLHECGVVSLDEYGIERADLDAAYRAAVEGARDVICGEVRQGRLCLNCYIDILDSDRKPLLRVPFKDVITITGL